MGGKNKRKGYIKLFQSLTGNTLADDQNCLMQFELAIATKSNLFQCTLLYETRPYIDTDSVKKQNTFRVFEGNSNLSYYVSPSKPDQIEVLIDLERPCL